MSDPRVDATGMKLLAIADEAIGADQTWRFMLGDVHRVLAAADAADPLLPKVRALYEAALRDHGAPTYPDRHCRECLALSAFTTDDLARLGVKDGSE